MKSSPLVSTEIDTFYSQTSEEDRLTIGLGPLEFERNKELIGRYLPKKNGVIVDVGGGPGVYSSWLAGLGFAVHLVDPVEKHIHLAKKRSDKSKSKFTAHLGESRSLNFPDQSADLVILHGPLYHLQKKQDRLESIKEAKRITKKGGIVLGFAINHSSYAMVGLLNGVIHKPEFYEMCKQQLLTGIHNPPGSIPGFLAQAYFHKPAELKEEFEEAGLQPLDQIAVEGMIWLDKNYFETRSDTKKKEAMMSLLKATESDFSLLSLSPHMMIAAKN